MRVLRLGGKRNKYGAKRATVDGFKFDSKAEANRYGELVLLQRAGQIVELEVHPSWPIHINGLHVCDVEADFKYWKYAGTQLVVEDVKGKDNALSRLKRKLLRAARGIEIQVVR